MSVTRLESGKVAVEITSNADALLKAADHVRRHRLYRGANIFRNAVLELMGSNSGRRRTGRTYYVPGTRRTYTASAPGEPPAWRTGDLARSIRMSPDNPRQIGEEIQVGTELDYGAYLEFGTVHMSERPFFKPAWDSVQDQVMEILTSEDSTGEA